MLQTDVEDREIIEEWLSTRRRQNVHILVPKQQGEAGGACSGKCQNGSIKTRERMREEGCTIGAWESGAVAGA